ncbi:MAG: hypothetical protein K6T75_09185 [Acetobacteraceae bacterium]|nr:hypothetical protein [Acetobacteraceae bacterium]
MADGKGRLGRAAKRAAGGLGLATGCFWLVFAGCCSAAPKAGGWAAG